jgi:hypothetical protein
MALSDLAVFSEYTYDTMTETVQQQLDLFNEASQGCITLISAANQGDYSDKVFFKKIAGLVRRRNPATNGVITGVALPHLIDTMVKIAAGTPPVDLAPGQFKWIQQNPEEAGAALGLQLAKDMIADMLDLSLTAGRVALVQVPAIMVDISAAVAPANLPTFRQLQTTAMKFGDLSNEIACWTMHSAAAASLYDAALTNANALFNYGTVNVTRDPFGRLIIVSDSTGFVSGLDYFTMGLSADAIRIEQNDDFTDNVATLNGSENIARTYQAEWTYNVGVKGFSWNKTAGGRAPNAAAVGTSTNWTRIATSNKDLAGVCLKHR